MITSDPQPQQAKKTSSVSYGDWASAAVGQGLQIFGDWIADRRSQKYYKENLALNNDYQKAAELRNLNYQYDLTNREWAREKEYNSPSAQMSRYLQAGINPNALYSGASNTADASTGTAAAAAAGAPMYQAHGLGSVNAYQLYMQNEQLQLQKELAEASVRKQNADAEAVEIDNDTRGESNKLNLDLLEVEKGLKEFQKNFQQIQNEIAEATKAFDKQLKEYTALDKTNEYNFNVSERAFRISQYENLKQQLENDLVQQAIDITLGNMDIAAGGAKNALWRALKPWADKLVNFSNSASSKPLPISDVKHSISSTIPALVSAYFEIQRMVEDGTIFNPSQTIINKFLGNFPPHVQKIIQGKGLLEIIETWIDEAKNSDK